MDKNQKGPPGWNITDEEGPEITLGPEAMMPAQKVIEQAHKILQATFFTLPLKLDASEE